MSLPESVEKIIRSFQVRDNSRLVIFVNNHHIFDYDGNKLGMFDTIQSFYDNPNRSEAPYSKYLSPEEVLKIVEKYSEDDIIGFIESGDIEDLVYTLDEDSNDIDL